MLSSLVGPVDVPAAAVLIAFFIGCGIVATTFLTVYSSKQEITNKFELAKMAQAAETQIKLEAYKRDADKDMARLTSQREIEFKRIESGMVDLKVANNKPDPVRYDDDRG